MRLSIANSFGVRSSPAVTVRISRDELGPSRFIHEVDNLQAQRVEAISLSMGLLPLSLPTDTSGSRSGSSAARAWSGLPIVTELQQLARNSYKL